MAKIIKLNADDSNVYSNEVPLGIWYDATGGDVFINQITEKVNVKFIIQMEHRSWGIKGVDVIIPSQILSAEYYVELVNENGEETELLRKVEFDVGNFPQNDTDGSKVITVDGIYVILNKDFSVDYIKSYVETSTF